ncbi:MAG: APC family permease [Clostridiales bacterium]|nr:APC family permease [Clostridiales bacterium]
MAQNIKKQEIESNRNSYLESNKKINNSDNKNVPNEHYGFLTATAMIIGIVVGSGIYFKVDDVLNYTNGNIWLGVLVFCIGAFGIIFGSLTLTEFSMRTKSNGGVVGYYEEFVSKKVACGFGWFQTFVYYPTITSVVSWVAGIYTCILFGFENSLENQILVGFTYMTMFYIFNIVSVTFGGHIQNLSTFIKLIPLIGIGLVSILWNTAIPSSPGGVEMVTKQEMGIGWLAALAPVAYSFDGWIAATSITTEVKNPRRNMTLALIIGPLVVLAVYLMYFLGLNKILGVEYIMSVGDGAVNKVGELLLGGYGNRIILTLIIIAVLGVVNGIVLASLRMPQALASKEMIPFAKRVEVIHPKIHLSVWSCIISFAITSFWMAAHYLTQKWNILSGGDISEISIVFSYGSYLILYAKVMKTKKENSITSTFKGIICPIFATLGSLIILVGGFLSNPVYVTFFLLFCLAVCVMGFCYYYKVSKK